MSTLRAKLLENKISKPVLATGALLLAGLAIAIAPATAQDVPPSASGSGAASNVSPTAPPPDIQDVIKKFAAKEEEFRKARDNYTYRQVVKVMELSQDGDVGGTYEIDSDIIFTPQGARTEKVSYAPAPTLRHISMSPEDERDLKNIQPFVLTTAELPKYNIQYQGRQKVDEIGTYVFKVDPKTIEKGERYFQGMIWVDDRDFQIVKTYGKAVPDIRAKGGENLFPRFETYRQQIDGKYWFPVWTGADDTLYFNSGPQRIRMLVRYEDYKQFKSTVNITYGSEADKPPDIK